ncbi:MAG: EAL domain-containing protein [Clostridiales bacterium]|nr:EAL domain-containing protein [Clostridiales bacterium]
MIWFVITAAILAIVTVFCLVRAQRSDKEIAPIVAQILFWLLIPLVSNTVLALSNNPDVCRFCYTVYFISTTFMLFYFAQFAVKFCNYDKQLPLIRKIMAGVVALDVINLILNYGLHHVFQLSVVDGAVTFESLWYHKIHLVLSFLLFGVSLGAFIIKCIRTSKLYRDKYIVILFASVVTSAWELFHVFTNENVDQAIVGFSICGIFIYLYSLEYVPSVLMDEMKKTVLATVSDGILFFDENRECIYANSAAKLMLGMGINETANGFEKLLSLTGEDREESAHYESKSLTCTKIEDGEEYIYDVELHKLHDLQGKRIGSFAKITDNTERTKRENLNRYLATHDKLTGIYNTDRLYDSIREVLQNNPDKEFYVVASDIKEFKLVNDRYGREFADKLLIRIANLLKDKAASSTTRYGRIGSDKFGCLIEKSVFSEDTFISAMKEVPNIDRNLVIPIIMHVGAYEVEDKNMPVSAMFDRAFIAIAGVKHEAEAKVAYYEDDSRDALLWDQKVTEQLDNAILTGQIVPYLQAQVSREGKVVGAEVLVRWIHPEEGFMPPGRFLSVLEKNGMIGKIDQYIWECACRILRRWSYEGRDDLYLSVNISPKDFYMMDVPSIIIALADKYELDRKRLRLEITETIMMDDIDEKLKTIDRLREAGFIVEMDDFGSGYSSLNMLKDMPVDVLKLDMIFLNDTAHNERTKKIMSLIIDLAKSLDVPVIAEGVETVEQVDFLAKMGCDFFQGYYFARPVSLDEYEKKNLAAS